MIHKYPSVNFCIYCGAHDYAPDSNRSLGDEHIIPQAMWGQMLLPEASCQACERVTGRQEQLFLKGQIHAFRAVIKSPSKRPKDRPLALPLFVQESGETRKVLVDIDDYPLSVMLPIYSPPSVMVGGLLTRPNEGDMFLFQLENKNAILAEKYGIFPKSPTDSFHAPALNMSAFCRMLAKAAHAFAVAEMGRKGWQPYLLDYILSLSDPPPLRSHIGGDVKLYPKSESLHETRFITHPLLPDMLAVSIRLFAFLGAPTYVIVVGRKNL
jgi:hypothetical protein